jgi:integrase
MNAASIAKKPTIQKRTVVRGRLPNANYRTREYLTEREGERLMKAAGDNRHGHRDATMILLAFRHGLRASELCLLRWEQVDLAHGRLHVSSVKNGMPSVHPLTGTELRALRRLQREQEPGRYLFMSERGPPMSAVGFRRMMGRLGKAAKMPFPVHPHMLRHACGFKLANDGQDTRALQHHLGHKHPAHGPIYRALAQTVPGLLEGLGIRLRDAPQLAAGSWAHGAPDERWPCPYPTIALGLPRGLGAKAAT